jgi:hypothetical protein
MSPSAVSENRKKWLRATCFSGRTTLHNMTGQVLRPNGGAVANG